MSLHAVGTPGCWQDLPAKGETWVQGGQLAACAWELSTVAEVNPARLRGHGAVDGQAAAPGLFSAFYR